MELEELEGFDMEQYGFEELREVIEAMDLQDNDDESDDEKHDIYKCPKCGFMFEVRK